MQISDKEKDNTIMDIRKSINDIIADKEPVDLLLINVPSRWMNFKEGLFDLPNRYLEAASQNSGRLYGDQDYEPNHGLLSIAAYTREQGIATGLLDLQSLYYLKFRDKMDMDIGQVLMDTIRRKSPEVIGLSCMTPALPIARELAAKIRKSGYGKMIVLGGLATMQTEECLRDNCFDSLITGEGEYALAELVRRILANEDYSAIAGLVYVKEGRIVTNAENHMRGQPDVFPAYDMLPRELELIPRIYMGRGCSNGCAFCSPSAFFKQEYVGKTADQVRKEIIYLHNYFEFGVFLIGDLTLFTHTSAFREVCAFLAGGNYHEWWCQTQVTQIDENAVTMLEKAGCCEIALGFEDFQKGDEKIRSKNPDKDNAVRICRMIKKKGIGIQGYWLFGTAQEDFYSSLDKIRDICMFIREDLIDSVHISFMIPYPNIISGDYIIDNRNYCDFLDLKDSFYDYMPMHHTADLSAKEIFLLTQLAVSCCANEYYMKKWRNTNGNN